MNYRPDFTLLGGQPLPSRPPQWARAKLTVEQREEIRLRYADGETASALAVEFGVTVSTLRTFVLPRGRW